MRCLLVLVSYHHRNTEKVANVFAKVLDAQTKTPSQVNLEELQEYDLIGFGSGIYNDGHHPSLLDIAEKVPPVTAKEAFIFSTNGSPTVGKEVARRPNARGSYLEQYANKVHSPLRERLLPKGYIIVDEFFCPGFNTNSFLRFFGGINRGRPNAKDLERAEEFAQDLNRRLMIQNAER
jgi:flavodoxin